MSSQPAPPDRPTEDMAEDPAVVTYEVASAVNRGQVRENNEDSAIALDFRMSSGDQSAAAGIYAVADGMGGHTGGEVASQLALETAVQHIFQYLTHAKGQRPIPDQYRAWLTTAVEVANRVIYGEGGEMGTTLVLAMVVDHEAHIAHVGDSRAYVITRNFIRQITADQTPVQQLIDAGVITPEQAKEHPFRGVLDQAVGLDTSVDVELYTVAMEDGYYLLLCSDGLTGELDDATIQQIVLDAASLQAACDTLVERANASGGRDNISVVLVHLR